MRPSLVDRLRGIVNVPGAGSADSDRVHSPTIAPASRRADVEQVAHVLGGRVRQRSDGEVVVVDRRYAVDRTHGRVRIGDVVETLQSGAESLAALQRAWPGKNAPSYSERRPRLLFLDVETTGLAGGAGTQAFLVGCG